MIKIDCDTCPMRDIACGDCVVSYLLDTLPGGAQLDDGELAAINVLAGAGIVPPLQPVASL